MFEVLVFAVARGGYLIYTKKTKQRGVFRVYCWS